LHRLIWALPVTRSGNMSGRPVRQFLLPVTGNTSPNARDWSTISSWPDADIDVPEIHEIVGSPLH